MADRVDFYFRQRVTEAELDLAFDLLEQADRHLAADIGVYGIVSGAVPTPHEPVPDLSIDLTAPARAYDHLGQRVFFGTGQTVDCTVDSVGLPTDVAHAENERWLGVFLRFDRQLSDSRTDGNSQQVFFRHDESFELLVRQAPEGIAGLAPKVELRDDELLVCDVRRRPGQRQILAEDIDLSRRQSFIFAHGGAVEIDRSTWSVLRPALNTAQAALDSVDSELASHFSGTHRRHPANAIDYPPHGFITGETLQAALDELIDGLSRASDPAGAAHVGAAEVPGAPHGLAASHVGQQLAQLLAWLNAHVGATSRAHTAATITAEPHNYVQGRSVQAQLQEIVDDLQSASFGRGATQVGNSRISGSPRTLSTGTVRGHLTSLLSFLNEHLTGDDHDGRYYRLGHPVDDADTLDGRHAAELALAGHDHDSRYLFRTYSQGLVFNPGEQRDVTTLAYQPELITSAYNYLDDDGLPEATTYVRGGLDDDIRLWVTKVAGGGDDKDYQVTVENRSAFKLLITINIYRRAS